MLWHQQQDRQQCCIKRQHTTPTSSSFLCQAKDSAFDVGGWDTYGDHWRYFFDCMLAPMASQAQSALEKLPVTATPRASLDTPNNFMSSVMKSWTSMVAEITAGSKEAKGGYNVVPARLFAYALAPQHGPVIRTSLSHLSAEYRKWVQDQVRMVETCGHSGSLLCFGNGRQRQRLRGQHEPRSLCSAHTTPGCQPDLANPCVSCGMPPFACRLLPPRPAMWW